MKIAKGIIAVSILLALGSQVVDGRKDGWTPQRPQYRATTSTAEVQEGKDYDCREVVGYKVNRTSRSRGIQKQPIRECPHAEKMEAGLCEMHWFKGMRCIRQ